MLLSVCKCWYDIVVDFAPIIRTIGRLFAWYEVHCDLVVRREIEVLLLKADTVKKRNEVLNLQGTNTSFFRRLSDLPGHLRAMVIGFVCKN